MSRTTSMHSPSSTGDWETCNNTKPCVRILGASVFCVVLRKTNTPERRKELSLAKTCNQDGAKAKRHTTLSLTSVVKTRALQLNHAALLKNCQLCLEQTDILIVTTADMFNFGHVEAQTRLYSVKRMGVAVSRTRMGVAVYTHSPHAYWTTKACVGIVY